MSRDACRHHPRLRCAVGFGDKPPFGWRGVCRRDQRQRPGDLRRHRHSCREVPRWICPTDGVGVCRATHRTLTLSSFGTNADSPTWPRLPPFIPVAHKSTTTIATAPMAVTSPAHRRVAAWPTLPQSRKPMPPPLVVVIPLRHLRRRRRREQELAYWRQPLTLRVDTVSTV